MTTNPDPVERVAQAMAEIGQVPTMFQCKAAIHEYKLWLTEQGIPVEQLLSGEMEAVPKKLMDYVRLCNDRSPEEWGKRGFTIDIR